MINTDMREYGYYLYGNESGYGQGQLSNEVKGSVKMSINTTSQSIQDNIKYKDATYIGLTFGEVDDTFVIAYGDELLKVLYVNPKGRYKQVFMKEM